MRRPRTEADRASRRLAILWIGVSALAVAVLLGSLFRTTPFAWLFLYVGPLPILLYLLVEEYRERRRRRIERRLIEALERTIERVSR